MLLPNYPDIDFGSRLSVMRAVCMELNLPNSQIPAQTMANSERTYLKFINYCRVALQLPPLLDLDYTGFTSAINAIAGAFVVAVNVTPPVVTGSTALNGILTSTAGVWLHTNGAVYAYQWLRDGVVIGGATGGARAITAADQGHSLSCRVTVTTPAGVSAPAVSNVVAIPEGSGEDAGEGDGEDEAESRAKSKSKK
jgi:hypothetical protein